MFKPATTKLPAWHQEPAPFYRRAPLSRRYRLFILIAIGIFLWHRYSGSAVFDESIERSIDTKIARSYPVERERLVSQAVVLDSDIEAGSEQSFPVVTGPHSDDVEASPPVIENQNENRGGISSPEDNNQASDSLLSAPTVEGDKSDEDSVDPVAGKSDVDSSAPVLNEKSDSKDPAPDSDEKDPAPVDVKAKEMAPEYSEEDSGHKEPILDSRKKQAHEHSEIIEEEPPELVKQASSKLVEQHLSPASQYDKEPATNKKASKKLPSKEHGNPRFPPYAFFADLTEKGESMPDIIHTPFEDATKDIVLQGWEDQWFADAEVDVAKWGKLEEPKIDFVYTWVNGSEEAFQETILPYEKNSTLNDPEGKWIESHRVNRYRDWDELRYSIRSVEKYASTFRNKIQLLVNAVADPNDAEFATVENPAAIIGKQKPLWLNDKPETNDVVQILSQEDFFGEEEQGCLPTFNSLTIENQLFNTKSDTDRLFALSDDMLLGKPHAASDIYSPLFGPTMGFKTNSYNTMNPPTDLDARRFGEKPFLIYTSWLLNRRFGERKRKGQIHFGHSLSRSVTREAINSFPRPAMQSACQRFRGETGFQLYSWYVTFHYTMERHREALLWSYIMVRSDTDENGNLGWKERKAIMDDLEEGMIKETEPLFRKRMFYNMNEALESVGLEAPKVNVDVQWTSLDGPAVIQNIECLEFNVNECLAPGFSTPSSDEHTTNHVFSTASIFDRVARQHPKCGDCLLKLILNRAQKGLSPLLPHADTQAEDRATVIKALWKYQYTIVDPDAFFVMITDAEQVENVLFKRMVKKKGKVGQLCLNDDVNTEEESAVEEVRKVMIKLLETMVPEPSPFEKVSEAGSKKKH